MGQIDRFKACFTFQALKIERDNQATNGISIHKKKANPLALGICPIWDNIRLLYLIIEV
ncbi:hypothetical protein SAMN05421820_101432 [Pedobacter steynii]|uniref:Uncharacterized protein n=1 Tax=Pedobacter steynii TaxID=430522 RepID=A0A1G9K104_9SPHI|nr:hypothetical protein SAMN05421820_101432 [Pedobacter steynii]